MYENAYIAAGKGTTIGFCLMCVGLIHTYWFGALATLLVEGHELQKIAFGEMTMGAGIFVYTVMISSMLHDSYERGTPDVVQ